MKLIAVLFAVFMVVESDPVRAEHDRQSYFGVDDVIAEVLVARPLGLIGTVVGTGIFIGIIPLTALASMAPPHDGFEKTANALIFAPAWFTFQRPLGVYCFDPQGIYADPYCDADRDALIEGRSR